MILLFDKENCDKRNFPEKILSGIKMHTCRVDQHNRWKVGMSIQFFKMNPRNGGSQFATGRVACVDCIRILPSYNKIIVITKTSTTDRAIVTFQTIESLNTFAERDGFKDWEEMKSYFKNEFEGKLIIWEKPVKKTGK